jgi:hypothetical protein
VSIAAPHYDRFKEQAVADGAVYTFTENGEFLVFLIGAHEVIPFWSSCSRMQRVQALHAKYRKYEVREMPISEFLAWLPTLEAKGIHIGANWSGKRLVGYNVGVSELLPGLEYWRLKRVGQGH